MARCWKTRLVAPTQAFFNWNRFCSHSRSSLPEVNKLCSNPVTDLTSTFLFPTAHPVQIGKLDATEREREKSSKKNIFMMRVKREREGRASTQWEKREKMGYWHAMIIDYWMVEHDTKAINQCPMTLFVVGLEHVNPFYPMSPPFS